MAAEDGSDDANRRLEEVEDELQEWARKLVKLETSVGSLLESQRDDRRDMREDRTVNREFRKEVRDAVNALTRERPDGSREATPGRLDFKSWVAIVATVVVPIVVAIILQH